MRGKAEEGQGHSQDFWLGGGLIEPKLFEAKTIFPPAAALSTGQI